MSGFVEVVIDSVRVSLTNQQRIVVLREVNTERYLPIWIGPYEAEAITVALQEIEVARPQTHDLLRNLINQLGGVLSRVEIRELREDVFYGYLLIAQAEDTVEVEARPSDALALAVRAHAPIFVSDEVMGVAGIVPEADVQAPMPTEQVSDEPTAEEESGSDHLSVFEDFLSGLDFDPPSDDAPGEEGDEDDDETPNPDRP